MPAGLPVHAVHRARLDPTWIHSQHGRGKAEEPSAAGRLRPDHEHPAATAGTAAAAAPTTPLVSSSSSSRSPPTTDPSRMLVRHALQFKTSDGPSKVVTVEHL